VEDVVGNNDQVTADHLDKLVYMEQVITRLRNFKHHVYFNISYYSSFLFVLGLYGNVEAISTTNKFLSGGT